MGNTIRDRVQNQFYKCFLKKIFTLLIYVFPLRMRHKQKLKKQKKNINNKTLF